MRPWYNTEAMGSNLEDKFQTLHEIDAQLR